MIESITEGYHAGGLIILNEDTDPVWLTEDDQQLYRTIQSNDDYVWLSVATLEMPLPDNILFLDGVNPEDGGILDLPIVKNKDGLINVFSEDEEYFYSSLALNNVYAVFNEAGELSVIERYYVPWY